MGIREIQIPIKFFPKSLKHSTIFKKHSMDTYIAARPDTNSDLSSGSEMTTCDLSVIHLFAAIQSIAHIFSLFVYI